MAVATRYFQPAAATWVTSTAYAVGDYVLGTDNKNWRCITAHTASASDRPITGASYATYWEECDGTTWNKRAALYAGSAWSAVITAFNFTSGADSLLCLIEGNKTYTITNTLTTGSFTSGAPSLARPLTFLGCDSSGVALSVPDGNWTSDQAAYDTSSFPVLNTTTNIRTITGSVNFIMRLIKFTASGSTTTGFVVSDCQLSWCYVLNSASNTSSVAVASGTLENCVVEMSGSSYSHATASAFIFNSRIIGNASATSGNRHGINTSGSNVVVVKSTFINNVGSGLLMTASPGSIRHIFQNTAHGNGYGIRLSSNAGQTSGNLIFGNYIAGSTTAGIDGQSQGYAVIQSNRLRDNGTSGNFNALAGNPLTTEVNYTTDSDDASELVNVAGGDYRIKNTATIWGMGFGVSEEPPASSAGGSFAFIG